MPALIHRRMPLERESRTVKLEISTLTMYAIIGFMEDGSVGEVFLKAGQVGSLERGLLDALGIMISISLQHGVPLSKIVEKLKNLHFEPFGLTRSKGIPMASSPLDMLAQWMETALLSQP